MVFLVEFNVLRPDPGLIVWTILIFGLFWFLMAKFAFKPIAEALKTRENDIKSALDEADHARKQMAKLKSENEAILQEARQERSKIIKEANDLKNSIIKEAKDKAKDEANKILTSATLEIENQKKAALTEVKNQVGSMAVQIAEKILKKELSNSPEQTNFVHTLVDEMNLN